MQVQAQPQQDGEHSDGREHRLDRNELEQGEQGDGQEHPPPRPVGGVKGGAEGHEHEEESEQVTYSAYPHGCLAGEWVDDEQSCGEQGYLRAEDERQEGVEHESTACVEDEGEPVVLDGRADPVGVLTFLRVFGVYPLPPLRVRDSAD